MRSKKAFINIISSLLLQVFTVVCGFIVPKLIIKNFGSNVNGLVTSITQFLAYITLLESGFGPVVKSVLYKPIANKEKNKIEEILKASERFFRVISYIFIIYIIILCIVLPIILENEFNNLYTFSLVAIMAISLFAEYYFGMTYRLFLQADQKTYIISVIHIVTLILNTIMVVLLIYMKTSIQVVKLASALIYIVRPILLNLYVKKKYNINIKNAKLGYKIKQKWDGLAQHIAFVVHSNTDVVILTLFSNSTEVSVYSVYLLVVSGVRNLVCSLMGGVEASFGNMIAQDEKEVLNKNFKSYEGFYHTISTIIFISTLFLIMPFVRIYTKGIIDADYIRPVFAYLIVLAEFIWAIRQPYNELIKVAGHFKETNKGAWIEAISNIVISIILVWNFGIVGVAIGTLVTMFIRTIEFMYHSSKYILKRNIWYTFKRLFVIAVEGGIVACIVNNMPLIEVTEYSTWAIQSFIVGMISAIVVLTINCIVYRENIKKIIEIAKNIFKKEKIENN